MKNCEFTVGNVPITKEEVRSICLSKLDIQHASNFLDIGSGTGSVTVEAGMINKNIGIYSIECEDQAFDLTRKNIEKFNLQNVVQIKDKAPVNYPFEDKIDAVFVGGTRDNLTEIIEWAYDIMRCGAKIVFTFILIDNFYKCLDELDIYGFKNIDVCQVTVSKLNKLGKGRYFKPENPIFIVSAEK